VISFVEIARDLCQRAERLCRLLDDLFDALDKHANMKIDLNSTDSGLFVVVDAASM
jgi:hypothetical protein